MGPAIRNIVFLFLIFNLAFPIDAISDGHPKPKKWKGKGEVLEFESIPVITVKDF